MKKNFVNTTTALLMAGMMIVSPVNCGIAHAAQEVEDTSVPVVISANSESTEDLESADSLESTDAAAEELPIAGGWQVNKNALSIKKK